MKKVLFACAAMIALSVGAKAQLTYGVKAGLNVSSVSNVGGAGDNIKSKIGLNIGGLINYGVSEKFAVQGELLYSDQGYRNKVGSVGIVSLSENATLSYINIPIMAQYYIIPQFYVEAGPQIGFLASAKMDNWDNSRNDRRSFKDYLKSTDFSAGAGAGYLFPNKKLGINARYIFGLTNVFKESTKSCHNNVAQLGVFYKFGVKK